MLSSHDRGSAFESRLVHFGKMNKIWDKLAEDYEEKVLSLTKVSARRKQILAEIKKGKILNLGTGPTTYLNLALVKGGNIVVATDTSKKMLEVAGSTFIHKNLRYCRADNKNLPFSTRFFDSVISVNSILPKSKKDVDVMIKGIYRVLKKSGKFVAILPSYDNVKRVIKTYGINQKLDNKELRVFDSGQWQCFHTPETIKKMMLKNRFKHYKLSKLFLKTEEEIKQIKKIYEIDTSKHFFYEYFLVAKK